MSPVSTENLTLPESLAAGLREVGISTPLGLGDHDYAAAHGYCEWLAKNHYENFHVGTWLLPSSLREHAYNIYAYCRWSDDLADETGDTELSLALLEWWRGELDRAFAGEASHPVFVALMRSIEQLDLPHAPFVHLIDAFVQDQRVFRYQTHEDVLDYCTRSADPVGRIFLALIGYRDEERIALSDKTCTALQLANFWQDVENDLVRGRIYIPLEDMERFSVNEEDLGMPVATKEVCALLAFEVDRTRAMFMEGLPLRRRVRGRARFDIELFSRGGLAILDAIAAQGYDVLVRRPSIGKLRKARMLLRCLAGGIFPQPRSASS